MTCSCGEPCASCGRCKASHHSKENRRWLKENRGCTGFYPVGGYYQGGDEA